MQVGIVEQSGISSIKNKKSHNKNLCHLHQSLNSDTISFRGQAEIKAAGKIINKHVLISGGLGLTLSQIVGVDSAALLTNNMCMIRAIAKKVYKSNHYNKDEINRFIAASSLSTAGAKTAAGLFTLIPVAGNLANSALSAGITKTIGNNFVKLCEKGLS